MCSPTYFRRTTYFSIVKGSLIYKLTPFYFFKGDELKIIYLFLAALGLHCCAWVFSSCAKHRLLSVCSAQASRCSAFSCCGAQALGRAGSAAVPHGLSCSMACGIFLGQGSNMEGSLHWQTDSCLYWQLI